MNFTINHWIAIVIAGLGFTWVASDALGNNAMIIPLIVLLSVILVPGILIWIGNYLAENGGLNNGRKNISKILSPLLLIAASIVVVAYSYIKYLHPIFKNEVYIQSGGINGSINVNWEMMSAVGQNLSAAFTAIGLIGIAIVIYQVRDSRKWNRLSTTFSAMPNPIELEQLESEIDSVLYFWKREERDPLQDYEVRAIFGNALTQDDKNKLRSKYSWHHGVCDEDLAKRIEAAGRKYKLYMNLIERYCVAINSGIADSETAKMIYGFKFKSHYNKSINFIQMVRHEKGDPMIYIELERVVSGWYPKDIESAKLTY